jgi:hypothetical protein
MSGGDYYSERLVVAAAGDVRIQSAVVPATQSAVSPPRRPVERRSSLV